MKYSMIWRAESFRSVESSAWGSKRFLGSRTSTRANGHRRFARAIPNGRGGGQLQPTDLAAIPEDPARLPTGVGLLQPSGEARQPFSLEPRPAVLAGPAHRRRS